MILIELAWTFFKIGLFSFGGGYAMVPLMEREIASHGWLAAKEFADIVAISQMTPGPIAVNAATYIGFRVAGIQGSASATLGVFLPSLILVLLVAHFLGKFKESKIVAALLSGIRPATVGLIASAVFFFARMSFLSFPENTGAKEMFAMVSSGVFRLGIMEVGLAAFGIFLLILVGSKYFKLKPIPAVVLSAVLGMVLL
jgi:chromate transporter